MVRLNFKFTASMLRIRKSSPRYWRLTLTMPNILLLSPNSTLAAMDPYCPLLAEAVDFRARIEALPPLGPSSMPYRTRCLDMFLNVMQSLPRLIPGPEDDEPSYVGDNMAAVEEHDSDDEASVLVRIYPPTSLGILNIISRV
jgi:hypothetical protein